MYKMNPSTAHEKMKEMKDEIDDFGIERLANRNSWQMSFASGEPYKGYNQAWAMFKKYKYEYLSNTWATFLGVQKAGGSVYKGEKATTMIKFEMQSKLVEALNAKNEKELKTKRRPMYVGHSVFNIDQTTLKDSEVKQWDLGLSSVEDYMNLYTDKPQVTHGPQPCYIPSLDLVHIPMKENFKTQEEYYHTLMHEYGHSTGHATRLNRDGVTGKHKFGTLGYAKEELSVEYSTIGGCTLAGIIDQCKDQILAYLHNRKESAKKSGMTPEDFMKALNQGHKIIDYRVGQKENGL